MSGIPNTTILMVIFAVIVLAVLFLFVHGRAEIIKILAMFIPSALGQFA